MPQEVDVSARPPRQFVEDKEQQNISKNWLYKHRRELKKLTEFFAYQDARRLSEVTLEDLENFRKTWTGSSTAQKQTARATAAVLQLRHEATAG